MTKEEAVLMRTLIFKITKTSERTYPVGRREHVPSQKHLLLPILLTALITGQRGKAYYTVHHQQALQ